MANNRKGKGKGNGLYTPKTGTSASSNSSSDSVTYSSGSVSSGYIDAVNNVDVSNQSAQSGTGLTLSDQEIWVGTGTIHKSHSGRPIKSKQTASPAKVLEVFDQDWANNNTGRINAVTNSLIRSGILWGTGDTPHNYNSVRTALTTAIGLYQRSDQSQEFGQWLSSYRAKDTSTTSSSGGGVAGPTPQQLAQQRRQFRAAIVRMADQEGVDISRRDVARLARIQQKKNLSDIEVQNRLIRRLGADKNGDLSGQAGDVQDQLTQWAADNGVSLSETQIIKAAKQIALGKETLNGVVNNYRKTWVAGAYPAWKEQIDAGQDIADIAAPYIGTYKNMVGKTATINDPIIKQALQYVSPDGKPAVMSLFDFEKHVRTNDPSWANSPDGQNAYVGALNAIKQTFGMG